MFTFIKKVIKTGTATSSYPLEPIAQGQSANGTVHCVDCV